MAVTVPEWVELVGYGASIATFAAYWMTTMVPLRVAALIANVAFIVYAAMLHIHPVLVLHAVLLPLNAVRLLQMQRLVREVRAAARGSEMSASWLRPFARKRVFAAGQWLWQRGDPAHEMLFLIGGRFRVGESGPLLGAGELIGEIGLIAPERTRTLGIQCVEPGEALCISYGEMRQLVLQQPQFALHFMELAGRRLLNDVRRLEQHAAAPARAEPATVDPRPAADEPPARAAAL